MTPKLDGEFVTRMLIDLAEQDEFQVESYERSGVSSGFERARAFVLRQLASELPALLAARSDRDRLDWLEQHAMREDFEDRAGIRIERFTGSPDAEFNDACFRLREWGDTPLDRDGELDYSNRLYRQSDHATLREAVDAAMSAARSLIREESNG